jgi:Bacterial dnaA protein helix-turn-helix
MPQATTRTYNEHSCNPLQSRLEQSAVVRLVEGLVASGLGMAALQSRRAPGAEAPPAPSACGARPAPAEKTQPPREKIAAIRSQTRGPAGVARARQRAMYLAHVSGGLSLTAVGLAFGRDRTTVRHACALWEDARDDGDIDFALSCEEASLQAMATRLGLLNGAAVLAAEGQGAS